MTDDETRRKFEHGKRMLAEGLAAIGARSATIGNRQQRREAARELRKTPGAEWYIGPETWTCPRDHRPRTAKR